MFNNLEITYCFQVINYTLSHEKNEVQYLINIIEKKEVIQNLVYEYYKKNFERQVKISNELTNHIEIISIFSASIDFYDFEYIGIADVNDEPYLTNSIQLKEDIELVFKNRENRIVDFYNENNGKAIESCEAIITIIFYQK